MYMNMTNSYIRGDGVGDETAFWQKTYLHGQRRNHCRECCGSAEKGSTHSLSEPGGDSHQTSFV